MSQTFILYPAFVMALLTFLVAAWLLRCRIKAVREGLKPTYFRLNQGAKVPAYVTKATQHYDNLFEMPVLFYVVLALIYTTAQVDWILLGLAWAYVITRILHTFIHLKDNQLLSRLRVFLLSCGILVLLWLWLFIKLITV